MNYYKKLNPSKKWVEMLYRVIPVKYNDNTTGEKLEYLSSFGIWQGSMTIPSSSWMENLNPITEIEFKSLIGEQAERLNKYTYLRRKDNSFDIPPNDTKKPIYNRD